MHQRNRGNTEMAKNSRPRLRDRSRVRSKNVLIQATTPKTSTTGTTRSPTTESINIINGKTVDEERRNYARNMSATCREKYLKLPRKKALNHRLDSDLVKDREKLYKKRSERVKEVCKRYKDARRGLNPYEGEFFIYDMKNRLAWCRTAKVSHFSTQPKCKMKDCAICSVEPQHGLGTLQLSLVWMRIASAT